MSFFNIRLTGFWNDAFCRKNIFYVIFILLLCLLIYHDEYGICVKKNKTEYMIDKNTIEKKIRELIEDDAKPIKEKLINSCKNGMISGFISGIMSGGFSGCVIGSASYGLVNPMIIYLEHINSSKQPI